nr:dihydrofolate reductase motif-containing protein [Pandoravirus massiliensis]
MQMYNKRGGQCSLFAKGGFTYAGTVKTPEGSAVGLMAKDIIKARGLKISDLELALAEVDGAHPASRPPTDTTAMAPSVLDGIPERTKKGAEAAEKIVYSAAVAADGRYKAAREALVATIDAPPAALPLKAALVEAMLFTDGASLDRRISAVSRIESVVHLCAATATTNDSLASEMVMRVTIWLSEIVRGEVAPSRAGDPWMPMADVAYAAGRVCSAPLLDCVRLAVEQRPIVQIDSANTPQPNKSTSTSPWYHASQLARIIESFVSGLTDADQAQCSRERAEACRTPALGLVRALRPYMEESRYVDGAAPTRQRIDRMRAILTDVVDRAHGYRRDAFAHVLAMLTTVDRHHIRMDDTATAKTIDMLAFADPSRSAVLAGLDVMGRDSIYDDRFGGGVDNGQPYRQDDILTAISTHHTDLFVAILARTDAWGIGSLALASHSHYARVINAIKEDDARVNSRRLNGVALSGAVWLQRHGYADSYKPTIKKITPTLDGTALTGLRPLLLLCRSMPTAESMNAAERSRDLLSILTKACVLDCGGVIARCLDALGVHLGPDTDKRHRHPFKLAASLAKRAGSHASPTLMRIACTASLLWMRRTHWHSPGLAHPRQRAQIRVLVKGVVAGIDQWLRDAWLPLCRSRFSDLPGLVRFLGKFLRALCPDISECGHSDGQTITDLQTTFRCEGMALLAPGHSRPMPAQRTALALALFDAVRLPPRDCSSL